FGGAAALVVSRAVAVNRELRTLQTTLRAYGNDAGSAEGLRGLARNLTTSGLARDDALSAVQEIARRRTLSVAQGAEIAGLASDIAAVTGQAVADAVKDIAGIIEGGYPAIRKLDEAFNFLTAEELRQIRAMAEHGDKAQALDVAISALHRRFDGLREQAMGPAEQGLHRLSTAWNDLIEAVALSEPVMKAVANLAHNMEALSKWVAGPTEADKGFELSHQIVSENKRLLELQDQRRRLVATRETLGPAFATFPAELKELDRQIAAQEAKVNALIDKARAEAQAAEARLNVPADVNRPDSPPAIGVPVAPPSATITTAANDAAGAAEQERQRKIVDAAVDQYDRLAKALHGTSVERELAVARLRAEDEATERNLDGQERQRLIATRVAEAKLQLAVAAADLNRTVEAEIAGTLRIADAYGVSSEAVRQATIAARADQEVAKGSIETRDAIIARLRAQDEAQRRLNDAQKLADIQAQVTANLRLAAALRGNVEAVGAFEHGQRAATDAATALSSATIKGTAPVSGGVRAWDDPISRLAAQYGVPADFVRRIMQQESGGRSDLVSSAGAVGAMQVLPRTFSEVAKRYGIAGTVNDPAANLEAGVAYLSEQLRAFGSQDLAAYNAGPGRVRQYLDAARPLPTETRNYMSAVAGGAGVTPGAGLRQAADDADLYARALDRLRGANDNARISEAGHGRSIEDTVTALHDAELRNQAYDLVRRQGLAGQKDENAALEYWLSLLKEGEKALAS
ncbi:MAG TPA: transglycosylase SLT domain-containing protein, partial [Azospirillaceae bacterium]|nr:transglycosylase SLT domain-containing protein [Azospirillaceae bacterium]